MIASTRCPQGSRGSTSAVAMGGCPPRAWPGRKPGCNAPRGIRSRIVANAATRNRRHLAAARSPIGRGLCLLDLLQHLEDAFRRADEHALEGLRKTTPLERVAAGAIAFGHAVLPFRDLSAAGARGKPVIIPLAG